MRTLRVGSITVACLLTLACSDSVVVPSEAETIDQLTRDRTGFETAVRIVTAQPRILRIERRPNELTVLPSNADRERVAYVASLMQRHGIIYVSTDRSTEPSVDFTTFEHIGRRRYESRMLTYRPSLPPPNLVASIDAEIRRNPTADHTVFRSLGAGWYLRASSLGSEPRP